MSDLLMQNLNVVKRFFLSTAARRGGRLSNDGHDCISSYRGRVREILHSSGLSGIEITRGELSAPLLLKEGRVHWLWTTHS